MLAPRTVHTIGRVLPDGRQVIFDCVLSSAGCAWHRHEMDVVGAYVGVAPCAVDDVWTFLAGEPPAVRLMEMSKAVMSLGQAAQDLSPAVDEPGDLVFAVHRRVALRAMPMRRARLAILNEIVTACRVVGRGAAESMRSASARPPVTAATAGLLAALDAAGAEAQATLETDFPAVARRGSTLPI